MRLLLLCATLLCPVYAADAIEAFGRSWQVPVGTDWKWETDGDTPVLKLTVPRPSEKPRRPTQFASTDTSQFQRITVELDVKRQEIAADKKGKSLILVYAWRDPEHFNYVHLSSDEGTKQPVHNGVFHVYGGDRVRISPEQGFAALPSEDWIKVRLTYDAPTGIVSVSINGKSSPALEGIDLSLSGKSVGRFGIGSFFDTAQFRNVKIKGIAGE